MTKILLLVFIILSVSVVVLMQRRNSTLKKRFENITEFFTDINHIVNSIRYGNLSARVDTSVPQETKDLSESINRMIETLNDREQMIVEYQAELTNQNKFLSALIDSLSDGLLVLDEDYIILSANSRIKKWLKQPVIEGTSVFEFLKIPVEKEITELADDEIFLKDNKDLYFKASTRRIQSKEHEDKYMVVISNYTNQKEVDSLKEDFVATLTHDLKVPIIAEANMLEFFLQEKFGNLNDKQKEALNTMKSSNKELLDLVQIVLDTYKVKEGEIELNLESVSIKDYMDEIVEEMSVIAHKTNNKLVVNIKSDFDIKVDYLQFKRVIKNLVNNAISYGKSNSDIEINAEKKGKNVFIKVKDYGKGISEEDIEKIFNRYFSASKKFRKIGTGLGLYLSQKIVQAHNGTLTVSSKEGEYTEFCIKI
ncbi:MAG: ATP-binding protein [Candidatus Gastranaerophilales bacterium]|nr:ATP-binding protein [Candidatus Gastranaerophilales bacterium]